MYKKNLLTAIVVTMISAATFNSLKINAYELNIFNFDNIRMAENDKVADNTIMLTDIDGDDDAIVSGIMATSLSQDATLSTTDEVTVTYTYSDLNENTTEASTYTVNISAGGSWKLDQVGIYNVTSITGTNPVNNFMNESLENIYNTDIYVFSEYKATLSGASSSLTSAYGIKTPIGLAMINELMLLANSTWINRDFYQILSINFSDANGDFVQGDIFDYDGTRTTANISSISGIYTGTFYGKGQRIIGMNSTTGGLFDQLGTGAVIDDVHLISANITQSSATKGIGGIVNNVSGDVRIVNTSTDAAIEKNTTSTDSSAYGGGGIVGSHSEGLLTIENCYTVGSINSTTQGNTSFNIIGGIVGYSYNTGQIIFNNVYSQAILDSETGSIDVVGGLIGQTDKNTTISNSYYRGALISEEYVGGLVGRVFSGTTNMNNSFSYLDRLIGSSSWTGGVVGEIRVASGGIANANSATQWYSLNTSNSSGSGVITGINSEAPANYWTMNNMLAILGSFDWAYSTDFKTPKVYYENKRGTVVPYQNDTEIIIHPELSNFSVVSNNPHSITPTYQINWGTCTNNREVKIYSQSMQLGQTNPVSGVEITEDEYLGGVNNSGNQVINIEASCTYNGYTLTDSLEANVFVDKIVPTVSLEQNTIATTEFDVIYTYTLADPDGAITSNFEYGISDQTLSGNSPDTNKVWKSASPLPNSSTTTDASPNTINPNETTEISFRANYNANGTEFQDTLLMLNGQNQTTYTSKSKLGIKVNYNFLAPTTSGITITDPYNLINKNQGITVQTGTNQIQISTYYHEFTNNNNSTENVNITMYISNEENSFETTQKSFEISSASNIDGSYDSLNEEFLPTATGSSANNYTVTNKNQQLHINYNISNNSNYWYSQQTNPFKILVFPGGTTDAQVRNGKTPITVAQSVDQGAVNEFALTRTSESVDTKYDIFITNQNISYVFANIQDVYRWKAAPTVKVTSTFSETANQIVVYWDSRGGNDENLRKLKSHINITISDPDNMITGNINTHIDFGVSDLPNGISNATNSLQNCLNGYYLGSVGSSSVCHKTYTITNPGATEVILENDMEVSDPLDIEYLNKYLVYMISISIDIDLNGDGTTDILSHKAYDEVLSSPIPGTDYDGYLTLDIRTRNTNKE